MAKKKTIGPTDTLVVQKEENLFEKGALYLKEAEEFKITSEEDYAKATDTLVHVKAAMKKALAEKDRILAPAKIIMAVEKERWKPLEETLEKVDGILRKKMLEWFNAKEAKAKEDLKKLGDKIESGVISRPETIAKKEEAIYASVPAKTMRTESGGGSTTRQVKKLQIDDESLIPDKYWVIDEVALKKDVFADVKVPGASYKYENSLAII